MAIDFGMKFINTKGIYWTPEALIYLASPEYKIEVAPESAQIFQYKSKDVLLHGDLLITRKGDFTIGDGDRIIQRDGKPFHWPEVEIVMDPILEKALT